MVEPCYDLMTTEEEVELLCDLMKEAGPAHLLMTVPNIYADLREHFNNEILERWATKNPERAYPDGGKD